MASLDQLKQTFFDECDEAMQAIEAGLTEIGDGGHNDETVNAVFRGVHSVKGGAGIFGFDALVEFAHVFETVLDGIRRGSLEATPETVDVLLSASDVLSDLVQMSRSGADIPAGFGNDCRASLESIIEQDGRGGGAGGEDDGAPAPADFDGLDFVPVAVNLDDLAAEAGMREFAITLRPQPGMLKGGNDPLNLFRELRVLGELALTAQTDTVPALANLQADQTYIWWTATLKTTAARAQVEDIFGFVTDDCEVLIEEIGAPAVGFDAPLAAFGEPAPVPEVSESSTAAVEPFPVPEKVAPAIASPVPAETAGGPRPAAPTKPAATTTRIELDRIDRVVNMVGELVIAQAMLGQTVQELPEGTSFRLSQILEEVIHHTRELKDSVMSMRAQPVGAVFQRMPRLIREVAAKTKKKVRLETVGESTEVDRSIIERLSDPLTHIIRNSIDHGIESPADRLNAGKPEEGTVRLSAEHRGGRIVIEVKDDGAGINTERVLQKAREKGLVSPDATLSEEEIGNLIMLPGFSTAEKISDISGRGVGMDVVRSNIQEIGGRISLKSERGRGMTIQLSLPLTLAVMDGMVIKVGDQTYVMPLSAIVECLRPTKNEIHDLVGTTGMLKLRGDFVPVVRLGELLDINCGADSAEKVVIITEAGEGMRFGLVVDELLGHQQVVIKSIEESYGAVPGLAAATILGNGRVAFILDVEKLSDLAANQLPAGRAAA